MVIGGRDKYLVVEMVIKVVGLFLVLWALFYQLLRGFRVNYGCDSLLVD